jgi:hypothetical protein
MRGKPRTRPRWSNEAGRVSRPVTRGTSARTINRNRLPARPAGLDLAWHLLRAALFDVDHLVYLQPTLCRSPRNRTWHTARRKRVGCAFARRCGDGCPRGSCRIAPWAGCRSRKGDACPTLRDSVPKRLRSFRFEARGSSEIGVRWNAVYVRRPRNADPGLCCLRNASAERQTTSENCRSCLARGFVLRQIMPMVREGCRFLKRDQSDTDAGADRLNKCRQGARVQSAPLPTEAASLRAAFCYRAMSELALVEMMCQRIEIAKLPER